MQMNPIAKLLSDELSKRQQRNQKYSLRGFARALSLEPSVLSKLMRGQRIPGPKTLKKILQSLEISEKEQMQIRSWLNAVKFAGFEAESESLKTSNLEMVHYLVLEALKIRDFREYPERLRQGLMLEKDAFQKILRDLMEQRFVRIDSDSGKLKITTGKIHGPVYGARISQQTKVEVQYLKAAFKNIIKGVGESYSMTLAFPAEEVEVFKSLLLRSARQLKEESQRRVQEADSIFNLTFTFHPVLSKSK